MAPSSATQTHSQGLEGENISALFDWKSHLDLRRMKRPTVPHQLSSRMEDLRSDLKIRKYKDSIILPAFERALIISRDSALEKVGEILRKKTELIFQFLTTPDFQTMWVLSSKNGTMWFRKILNLRR